MESVTVVTEPLLHPDFVQFEVVVPILERLRARYDLTVAAPRIAAPVRERLESRGIRVADGGAIFPPLRRSRDEIPSYVGSWLRDALVGGNRRGIERALRGVEGPRINVSMTTAIDADAWLIQSRPLGMALEALERGVNRGALRTAIGSAAPVVGLVDEHHLLDAGRRARVRYATTQHVADWFGSRGLPVDQVLPMYYRPTIERSTANPARDSVVVYLAKETDSAALKLLLETGLPVTMFGTKSPWWVAKSLQLNRYPNARLLGYVSDAELSDLYSNARFTAFPFTEEPFGLVPLESMACGTPVLTYGEQGPAESVLDGRTGWFVRSPEEFARRAVELWKLGPPNSAMVAECLRRAQRYHINSVQAGWSHIFDAALSRSGGYAIPRRRGLGRASWSSAPALVSPAPSGIAVGGRPDQIDLRPFGPAVAGADPIETVAPRLEVVPGEARSGAYAESYAPPERSTPPGPNPSPRPSTEPAAPLTS